MLSWRVWLYIIPAGLVLAALIGGQDHILLDYWGRFFSFIVVMMVGWAVIAAGSDTSD